MSDEARTGVGHPADIPPDEARATLQAIQAGEVDAFVVHRGEAPAVYLLKDPDRLYQVIIERMSEGAVLLAQDGTVLYGNASFAALVGLDKNALVSRPFHDFVVPEHQRRLASTLRLARSAPAAAELSLAGDAGFRPIYLSASPIELADWSSCLVLVVSDLSTRRRSAQVAAAEEFARAVLDQATEAIVVCDTEGVVTHASLAAQALCRASPLGRPFAEAFPLQGSAPLGDEQAAELELADGADRRHLLGRQGPLKAADGRMLGRIVTLSDISEQKRMQKALSESEAALRQLIATLPGMVWTCTPQGRLDFMSRQWYDYTGTVAPEAPEEAMRNPIHPDDRERVVGSWRGAVHAATAFEVEFRLRRHDGAYRWFKSRGTPIRDGDGNLIRWLGTVSDIDDLKLAEVFLRDSRDALERLVEERTAELVRANQALTAEQERQQALIRKLEEAQSQLVQSEKMASIGQLAAGVAHEINNPIGFVSSNLESLKTYADDLLAVLAAYERRAAPLLAAHPEAAADIAEARAKADLDFLRQDLPGLLQETRDGIRRVRKIVQDLKEFSHVSDIEWQAADLHRGLDSTLNVVWNELKYKARVVKEYGDIPLVECLPSEINQVFMNLLVNAADAIPEAGVITLRSGRREDWVWIEVADDGAGIAPENLPRVFDPFFTTKPVGKGTGLGLSVSYGIVKKHGGRIEVESAAGKGSTFRIWLPVSQSLVAAPG